MVDVVTGVSSVIYVSQCSCWIRSFSISLVLTVFGKALIELNIFVLNLAPKLCMLKLKITKFVVQSTGTFVIPNLLGTPRA